MCDVVESCVMDHLIVPKEEIVDGLVVPDRCKDTDGIIPKEELSDNSPINDELNEPSVAMVTPIKIEQILCDNIAQQRNVSDEDVFTRDIAAELNGEPCKDSSVGAACNPPMLKKCKQSQGGQTTEKLKLYSCDICKKIYTARNTLVIHLRTHTGEKPFSCELCQKKFIRSTILKSHMRTHTGEKPFTCDVCQKSFSHNGCLNKHMKIHTGEKPHSCDLCLKKFIQKCNLRKHMRTHSGKKLYSCDLCEKTFANTNRLLKHTTTYRHKQRIHTKGKFSSSETEKQKLFPCNVCKDQFLSRSALDTHIRTCTGDNPYFCDLCEKKFASSNLLFMHHLEIHTEEKFGSSVEKQKLFPCNVCNKQFVSRSALDIHIRTHTSEKPYVCDLCEKEFASSNLLFMHHLENHTEEKFGSSVEKQKHFPCNVCEKHFLWRSALDSHMRIHSTEKSYFCDLRENELASTNVSVMDNLGPHIEEKLGFPIATQKLFPCNICERQFIRRSALDNHKRTHIGEKVYVSVHGKRYLTAISGFGKKVPNGRGTRKRRREEKREEKRT